MQCIGFLFADNVRVCVLQIIQGNLLQAFLVGRTAASRAGGAPVTCRQHTELESADWPPHIDASSFGPDIARFFRCRDGKENTARVSGQGSKPGESTVHNFVQQSWLNR